VKAIGASGAEGGTDGATARPREDAPRRFLSGPLARLLRRPPTEIERRSEHFAIRDVEGRRLVARLGSAFIEGFNAALASGALGHLVEEGAKVEPHFRPFFFEGVAMGYLPRGWLFRGGGAPNAERDLRDMAPEYLYLYYVGLGFWMAIRHPRAPRAIERLGAHLDPLYLPLCYDGFGFKVGFFDYPARPASRRLLDNGPEQHRAALYQGFGRALFFVFMDDEDGFRRACDASDGHRGEMEFGRSLALAFTGIDRPERIAAHVECATDSADRDARLTGVTWALAARAMTDPEYFRACVARAPGDWGALLARLPILCEEARLMSRTYAVWQSRTRSAAARAYAERGAVGTAPAP
jgi:hypothetical protein